MYSLGLALRVALQMAMRLCEACLAALLKSCLIPHRPCKWLRGLPNCLCAVCAAIHVNRLPSINHMGDSDMHSKDLARYNRISWKMPVARRQM